MVTVMQSTTAGMPEGERKREASFPFPCCEESALTTSLANLKSFFTVSSPRLATKARCNGGVGGERGGERRAEVEAGVGV